MPFPVSDISASALNAFSVGLSVTAHNIANVNTNGFNPSHVVYETGPGDQGVRVSDVTKDTLAAPRPPMELVVQHPGGFSENIQGTVIDPSNTNLAREMVDLITTQRFFEGNAAAFHVGNEMTGALLDLKV